MSNSETMHEAPATDAEPTRRRVVGMAANAIAHRLPTGDVAQLRRLSPREPYAPAVWKLLLDCVPEAWLAGPDREQKEQRWAALFMGMAHAAGPHDPGTPLGRALAESGWSELRFVRLMRARGDGLFEEVRRLAQYLSSKSQPADWTGMANLLLDQDGEWAERHRRAIARDYYRALYAREHQAAN